MAPPDFIFMLTRDDVTVAIRQTLAAIGHRTAPLALGVPQS